MPEGTAASGPVRWRAVVLGGTGFVGRHLCAALTAHGYDVVALARRHVAVPGARTIGVDLAAVPADALTRLFAELSPALVVNAAGALWGGVTEQEMRRSNVLVVRTVLDALAALEARPRFVHLGTVHEYGDTPAGVRLTGTTPCRPTAAYGRTKLAATRLVTGAAGQVDAVVLRLANVLGPGIPEQSLPGRTAAALAAAEPGRTLRLRLELTPSARDFFDARDMTDAVLAAARGRVPGAAVPVGSGRALTARELVHALIAISGIPAELPAPAEPERGGAGAGPDAGSGVGLRSALGWQEVDPAVAAKALGWTARYRTSDALRSLWEAVTSPSRARTVSSTSGRARPGSSPSSERQHT
ncbi:NAD-dependent epimerase/dehydratase family protein [Streptomyces sp. SID11385]|nr:NAD-dependent epimerase/dehydratase family protein [Streptomyces sp. SID11385]